MTRRRRVAIVGAIGLIGLFSLSIGMSGGLLSDSVSLDDNEIEGGEDVETTEEPLGQSDASETSDAEAEDTTEDSEDDADDSDDSTADADDETV